MKVKHWCGCITDTKKGIVFFVYMCDLHRLNNSFTWIANQHYEELDKLTGAR